MLGVLPKLEVGLKRLDLGERLVRRNPLFYGAAAESIAALQNASLAQRVAFTDKRLRIVLDAARSTAYGRAAGSPASIERWPLLKKSAVRDDSAAFRASSAWLTMRASTGGTTGTPLKLLRSPESVVVEQVCIDQMIQALGADPLTARTAVLRGDNIKPPQDFSPPFWKHALGGRRLILSTNHLTDATIRHYCAAVEQFRPDLLWVYPSALESLCKILARSGLRLRVPRVLSSSEMLQPQVWTLAASVLGCSMLDYYGQAERVAFAYATSPDQYFFLPGYAFVELEKRSDRGELHEYEIVGTSLWNAAMPLIRYCTGDLIRVPASCSGDDLLEIANGLRPFSGVIGRSQDVLLAPDGVGVLTGIDHIPRGVDHVLRMQVEQHALDRVTMRVLAAPRFTELQAQQLMENARRKIPPAVQITLEVTDALHRTERGKTPFVIHSPVVQEAFRAAGLGVRS